MAAVGTLGVNIDQTINEINRGLEIVNVDQKAMIRFMNNLISLSSKVDQIFKSDITVWSPDGNIPNDVSLAQLLDWENKFFDSIAYLSLAVGNRPNAKNSVAADDLQKVDVKTTGKSLFFCYFMLMTKGSYQRNADIKADRRVPAFLSNVFNFEGNTEDVFKTLANFDIKKVGTRWVEYISITGLGAEAQQRFALSFPGYRLFQPIKVVEPDIKTNTRALEVVQVIRRFLARGYFWEIHSATRDPTLIATFGSFNANLANLMLELYTEATLTKMVKAKLLFKMPEYQYNANSYVSWTDDLFNGIARRIPVGRVPNAEELAQIAEEKVDDEAKEDEA